jgi:hypothetical protein
MIDVIAIPEWARTTHLRTATPDILDRLFSQVVVDAIDLVFFEHRGAPIERLRRGEIGAERFLDNKAAPHPILLASETRLPKMATDRRECCRWRREIEEPVTVRVTCLFDPREHSIKLLVRRRIVSIAIDVTYAVEQSIRDIIFDLAGPKAAQAFRHVGPECFIRHLAACCSCALKLVSSMGESRKPSCRNRWIR